MSVPFLFVCFFIGNGSNARLPSTKDIIQQNDIIVKNQTMPEQNKSVNCKYNACDMLYDVMWRSALWALVSVKINFTMAQIFINMGPITSQNHWQFDCFFNFFQTKNKINIKKPA